MVCESRCMCGIGGASILGVMALMEKGWSYESGMTATSLSSGQWSKTKTLTVHLLAQDPA